MAYKSMFPKRKQNKRKMPASLPFKSAISPKYKSEEEFDACVDEIFKENEAVFRALGRA